MGEMITYVTELLVGLACVGLAAATWRRPGTWLRVIAALFGVAGLAAIVHSVVRLAQ